MSLLKWKCFCIGLLKVERVQLLRALYFCTFNQLLNQIIFKTDLSKQKDGFFHLELHHFSTLQIYRFTKQFLIYSKWALQSVS